MNMKEIFSRGASLLGEDGIARLRASRVAVFGVGGVGGFAAEALARSGVGALDLIDHDTVSPSNINRQIIALHSTVGRKKVEVMAERKLTDMLPEELQEAYAPIISVKDADIEQLLHSGGCFKGICMLPIF